MNMIEALVGLRDGIDTPEAHCEPLPITSSWRAIVDKALEDWDGRDMNESD